MKKGFPNRDGKAFFIMSSRYRQMSGYNKSSFFSLFAADKISELEIIILVY